MSLRTDALQRPYHLGAPNRERLLYLSTTTRSAGHLAGKSQSLTSPVSPSADGISEGVVRALENIPEHDAQPSWASSTNRSRLHHFTNPFDRNRQISWDYSDADAPPPYTPTQPRSSLSPATPSLSSGSLSALDSPLTPSPVMPLSPLQSRNRSVSSVGSTSDDISVSGAHRQHYRKRSASSAGLTMHTANVGPGQNRSTRQLPALPPRLVLPSPMNPEEAESHLPGSASSSDHGQLVVLFARIRKAISRLSEYVQSAGSSGQLLYGKVNERVLDIAEAVRTLLYVTAMPVDDDWHKKVPEHIRRSCTPRYTSESLRSAYWKVVAPLSGLITTTVALQHDPALSVPDSRLEVILPELEATIRDFVKEVQRTQQEGIRSPPGTPSSVKSYRGSFLTPGTGFGPGAGSAGSWMGLGYVQATRKSLRSLDASVIPEVNALVGPVERKLRGLVASSSSAHNKAGESKCSHGAGIY